MMDALMPQLEYLLRILSALLCGLLIGRERDNQMKMAGIRTHSIVALTSAVIMIISKYGFYDVLDNPGIGLDPSRVAAGIVTAVGFLGAGVIFTRRQNVSGLTTAAGIWSVVGIGMAFGAGMYLLGVVCTVAIIALQLVFHRNFKWMRNPIAAEVVIQIQEDEDITEIVDALRSDRKAAVSNIQVNRTEQSMLIIRLTIRIADTRDIQAAVDLLKENPHIKSISL